MVVAALATILAGAEPAASQGCRQEHCVDSSFARLDGERALVPVMIRRGDDPLGPFSIVRVLELAGGAWTPVADLVPSDDITSIEPASLDGDRALLSPGDADTVYVWERVGESWRERAELIPSDLGAGDGFGFPGSLDGNQALVRAWSRDPGLPGVPGSVAWAYIFELGDDGRWEETARLAGNDAAEERDSFGHSLSLDGQRALIGAPVDDHAGEVSGAAYIFELQDDGSWDRVRLIASDAGEGDQFGKSVSLDGDRALIGAPMADLAAGEGEGAVYVFERVGDDWLENHKLSVSDLQPGDNFGAQVSLEGNRALIGTKDAGPGVTARLFDFSDGQWDEVCELTADRGGDMNHVDLSGEWAILSGRGSWFFSLPPPPPTDPPPARPPFRRGDTNVDGNLDLTDAVVVLNWLFLEAPTPGCIATADANGVAGVNLTDAVWLLNYFFLGGLPPVAPYPDCGPGRTADYEAPLGCESAPRACE